jgi:hypothetical protein
MAGAMFCLYLLSDSLTAQWFPARRGVRGYESSGHHPAVLIGPAAGDGATPMAYMKAEA